MVALEEVGPAADFGSLCLGCGLRLWTSARGSAFLGVGVPGVPGVPVAEPGAHLKAPLPLPTPATSARIGKDGTLSKKVGFRMLKQLRCEVLSDEDGEARYVQVGIKTQPVLFKMLVELGHAPRRGEDGEFMVQVVEQCGRKPEEVVAALSAPREPEDEGYPSMPRPRLKPEDAQLLVNRLYKVPRRSKLAQFFNWRVMSVTFTGVSPCPQTEIADRNMSASPRGKSSTGCWIHRAPCHWRFPHPARG
ncbi:unnamed protein product [Symbiodinium sp. CCMP2592]|nr:unnamed protein product [Symbiodinium sp. CCMP2592]